MTDLNSYMINRISHYAPGSSHGGNATLQAVRRRDYNALDPHATLVIVDQAITYLRSRRETLETEAARLERLQPVLAPPHWRKDRHGQPRYLYLIHPTQDPSTLLRTGLALASESTSAPTPKPRRQPWPASKPGMNFRPSRTRCVR